MKKYLSLSIASVLGLLWSLPAKAVCPVCTIAVGAGVGFSRYLGIDDTISGIWVGGLTMSMSFWTVDWLRKRKKKINFKGITLVTVAAYYLLVVLPLQFTGIIGHPFNKIWGADKLLLGIIIGSIIFTIAVRWYEQLKKNNNGHAYFPFQKVAMPVGALLALSFVFYFLTR